MVEKNNVLGEKSKNFNEYNFKINKSGKKGIRKQYGRKSEKCIDYDPNIENPFNKNINNNSTETEKNTNDYQNDNENNNKKKKKRSKKKRYGRSSLGGVDFFDLDSVYSEYDTESNDSSFTNNSASTVSISHNSITNSGSSATKRSPSSISNKVGSPQSLNTTTTTSTTSLVGSPQSFTQTMNDTNNINNNFRKRKRNINKNNNNKRNRYGRNSQKIINFDIKNLHKEYDLESNDSSGVGNVNITPPKKNNINNTVTCNDSDKKRKKRKKKKKLGRTSEILFDLKNLNINEDTKTETSKPPINYHNNRACISYAILPDNTTSEPTNTDDKDKQNEICKNTNINNSNNRDLAVLLCASVIVVSAMVHKWYK